MAAIIYYFGIIFSVLLAFKQAEAVQCYRCVYMEEDGAVEEIVEEAAEGEAAEDGAAQAQTAPEPVTYGNADCKEDGDKFRIDYVTQDECTGELELAPVAAYEALDNVVNWNDILEAGDAGATAEQFSCKKTKFSMTSTESVDKKLNVWYRGCAYEAEEECTDLAEMKEKHLFQEIYAHIYGVKKDTVSLEGESCACLEDTCNGGSHVQISGILAAVCSAVIYATMRR